MEKKSIVGNVVTVILIAVLLVGYFVAEMDFLFTKEAKDIFQLIEEDGEPTKGEYVSVGVDAVVDWYAETKHTTNGIPTGKEKHCIIWLDDTSFISLTAKGKKNYEKLEAIMDETYNFLDGTSMYLPEPITFEGRIGSMNSEIRGYYQDVLSYWGISSADGMTIYEVTIDTTSTPTIAWLLFAGVAIIEVIAVAVLVSQVKHNKMVDAQAAAAKATAMMYDNNAPITDENNNIYS